MGRSDRYISHSPTFCDDEANDYAICNFHGQASESNAWSCTPSAAIVVRLFAGEFPALNKLQAQYKD